MQWLRFIHVVSMVLWLGTAASEVVLELVLWRTRSPAKQRAYIELHRIIDLVLEGPALLATLVTGLLLLWRKGYFINTTKWPSWLEDKLLCVAVIIVANLVCIFFVFMRAKKAESILGSASPLENSQVKKWHMAVTSTFIAVPFGLVALWLAVVK